MNLDEIQSLLDSKRPSEIFGADIEATLTRLQAACHPDLHPGDPRAETLFKQLGTLANEAKRPAIKIKSPKRSYELTRRIAVGDASDVWDATSGGKEYIVKVSRIRGGETLLDNEHKTLSTLHTASGDDHYAAFFPMPSESFPARDRKRVNVFVSKPGFFTLEQVREKHAAGLDGKHLAWIFKRSLTAIGFAHQHGIVHGAVVPSHLMVNPANHGAMLVGWIHAVKPGERIKTISVRHRPFYAPEVAAKKPVGAGTDIYMAAKCMEYLSASDVPVKMLRFFKGCLFDSLAMRPGDAWELHDEFDELLRGLYGKPKFHHLSMA